MAPKKEAPKKKEVTPADKAVEMVIANDKVGLEAHLEEQQGAGAKTINKLDQKWGKTALFAACEEGRLELVKMIMDYGAKVNFRTKDGNTSIMGAAYNGETEIIAYLIENSGEVDAVGANGETAMHIAARRGHLATVELLHCNGAAIDTISTTHETPLGNALKFMHWKVCDYLLDKGADINTRGVSDNTPLTRSAFDGRLETMRYILDHGGDIAARQSSGEDSVLIALKGDHFKLATLLLERDRRVSIDSRDCCSRTALMLGCMMAKKALVDYCIEKGANVDAVDDWGYTPLIFAVKHPRGGIIVDCLLANGADPNMLDKTFNSALHYASMKGQLASFNALLAAGANPEYRNDDNKTAVEVLLNPENIAGGLAVGTTNIQNVEAALQAHAGKVKPCKYSQPDLPKWLVKVNMYEEAERVAEEKAAAERARLEEERRIEEERILLEEEQRLIAEAAALKLAAEASAPPVE